MKISVDLMLKQSYTISKVLQGSLESQMENLISDHNKNINRSMLAIKESLSPKVNSLKNIHKEIEKYNKKLKGANNQQTQLINQHLQALNEDKNDIIEDSEGNLNSYNF